MKKVDIRELGEKIKDADRLPVVVSRHIDPIDKESPLLVARLCQEMKDRLERLSGLIDRSVVGGADFKDRLSFWLSPDERKELLGGSENIVLAELKKDMTLRTFFHNAGLFSTLYSFSISLSIAADIPDPNSRPLFLGAVLMAVSMVQGGLILNEESRRFYGQRVVPIDSGLSNFRETVNKKARLKRAKKAHTKSLTDDVKAREYLEVLQHKIIPAFETAFAFFSAFASEELFARFRKIYQAIGKIQKSSSSQSEFSSRILGKIDGLLPRLKAFYEFLDRSRDSVLRIKQKVQSTMREVQAEEAVASLEDRLSGHLGAQVEPLKKINAEVISIRDMVAKVWIDIDSLERVLGTIVNGDLEEIKALDASSKQVSTEAGGVDLTDSKIAEEVEDALVVGASEKVKQ